MGGQLVSKTSVYLRNLIELGIIEREFSVDAGTKERANTNRGLYKLKDHFFRFWYAFAFTNHSELETGDVDGVYEYAIAPSLMSFASFPFEEICRQYVRELQKARVLPFRYAEYLDTLAKLTPQKADASFYYALFSAAGFEEKICEAAKNEKNLYLFSLEDIMNP